MTSLYSHPTIRPRGDVTTGFLDLLWTGVLAGIPVGIALGVLLTVRRKTVREFLRGVPLLGNVATVWAGSFVVAIVLGVLAAWVWDVARSSWGWSAAVFGGLAIGLAALLSVASFLPIWGGKRMAVAPEISTLNFIVLAGFGLLVPYFAA